MPLNGVQDKIIEFGERLLNGDWPAATADIKYSPQKKRLWLMKAQSIIVNRVLFQSVGSKSLKCVLKEQRVCPLKKEDNFQ